MVQIHTSHARCAAARCSLLAARCSLHAARSTQLPRSGEAYCSRSAAGAVVGGRRVLARAHRRGFEAPEGERGEDEQRERHGIFEWSS